MSKRRMADGTEYDDLVYRPEVDAGKGENMVLRRGPGEQQQAGTATPTGAGQNTYDLAMGYLNDYKNRQFSYDFNTDPYFQQAKEAYLKQGRLNARNVAAQAAAMTGGYGNSYGTVAAQSIMNQAADQVNNIIPSLQENAYNRYRDEQARTLSLADRYLDLYGRQRDWDWEDKARARQETEWGQADEDRERDNEWTAKARARQETEWGQADEDRDYTRKQQEEATAWSRAMQLASIGNFDALKGLGVDISTPEKQYLLELGMQYANMGDFSVLENLGVDTTFLRAQQNAQLSNYYAGGNSGRRGTGKVTEEEETVKSEKVQDIENKLTDTVNRFTYGVKNMANADNGQKYLDAAGIEGATIVGQGKGQWAGYTQLSDKKGGTYYVKVDGSGKNAAVYKYDSGTGKYYKYDPKTGRFLGK